MKAAMVALLLFSCCLSAFPGANANEANRLLALMRSRWSLGSLQTDSSDGSRKPTYSSLRVSTPQHGLREADKITRLPGQPHRVQFDQYAGYVTVDPMHGRALFYYFVEAPHEPRKKPLVLWLNGGPGCSSFGNGAMLELGPFFVNSDGKTLVTNKYAWNNVANMLFLESPAGVGFSYSNTTSDYDQSGDKRTAEDSYTFLINWLERFPEYKGRDFYITGESYAGFYIPELANAILANNKIADATVIKLKGVAIGNAYMDADTNSKALYDYCFAHAMISSQTHEAIQVKCSFTGNGNYSAACNKELDKAATEMGHVDFYNIYAPLCPKSSDSAKFSIRHAKSSQLDGSCALLGDPCADRHVYSYLNLPEVQRALHANTTRLQYPWKDCSDFIGPASWKDSPISMLPAVRQLIASNVRVWLYSGDIDAVVPVTSTQYSLDILRLPIEAPWRAWYTRDDQVGGRVVGYKGLVFATVRGAGHMVPRYQPQRALILFTSFLRAQLPPDY